MKTKLIIILLTFVGTTLFWCVLIFSCFFLFAQKNEVGFVMDGAKRLGYRAILAARNDESRPVTFTVTELPTNTITNGVKEIVLLERELPPAGAFWVGIKKKERNN